MDTKKLLCHDLYNTTDTMQTEKKAKGTVPDSGYANPAGCIGQLRTCHPV